jgi:hypothetical protein
MGFVSSNEKVQRLLSIPGRQIARDRCGVVPAVVVVESVSFNVLGAVCHFPKRRRFVSDASQGIGQGEDAVLLECVV